jgi:aryl-alcohol dehydrogenase-like predicted oxidoreductase
MEYRKLGASKLEVSVVGIGCWAIGGGPKGWGPVDDNESIAAIREGLDLGMTLVDTAPAYGYGHSEEVVGKALAGRRDRVVLATKCGLVWRETGGRIDCSLRPDSVRKECEASLRRLRVETIDLYQIHRPDPATPLGDTMSALLDLREQGKVRAIGVSNFNCQEMSEARRAGLVESLQPELSLLEPQAVDDLLPYCREYGIGVVTYGSLGRGLLTGKFNISSTFKDLRADDPRFRGEAFLQNLAFVEGLRAVAGRVGCTLAQLALRWVIQQDGVSSAIAGVKRPSQTRENAGAGEITIPAAEMEEIDRLLARRD